MASSPTTRNRLEKQGAGENNNTWGAPKLNTVLDLVDSALDGATTISASGATTLSSTNYAADQSRMRMLNVTASATATITIPSVEKWYIVRAVSADVIVTTGGATTATVKAGSTAVVFTPDGAAVYKMQDNDRGAVRLTNLGAPTSPLDAATKKYVDDTAFAAAALPGQTGNASKFVKTDGTLASWQFIVTTDVTDYVSDQLTRATALKGFAIAAALAL